MPHEIQKNSKSYTYSTILWFIASLALFMAIIYSYMLFSTIPLNTTVGKPNSFYGLIICMVVFSILLIVSLFALYAKFNEFKWARYLYVTSDKINRNLLNAEEILHLIDKSELMQLYLDKSHNVNYDVNIGDKSKVMNILDLSIIDVYNKYSSEGLNMLNDILLHYTFMQTRGINRRGVIEAFVSDLLDSQQKMMDDTEYLSTLIVTEYGNDAYVEKIISSSSDIALTKEDFATAFFYAYGLSNRVFQINKQKQVHSTLNVLQKNLLEYNSFISTLNDTNLEKINESAFNEIVNVNKSLLNVTNSYLTSISHNEANMGKIETIVTSMEELIANMDNLYQKNVTVTE